MAQGDRDAGEGVPGPRLVLEEAHEVARGGEAAAGDARVAAAVDDLVDAPRLEAAVEGDLRRPDEAPALPRQQPRRGQAMVPHVEPAVPPPGVDRRVLEVAGVGERRLVLPLADDDHGAHEPLDRPAAVGRDRRAQPEEPRPLRHVPLPAHPGEREALLQEPAVAELRGLAGVERRLGVLQSSQDALAAAVGDLVVDPPVAAADVHRLQEVEVGGEDDFAPLVSRGEPQVHDRLVLPQRRVERELDGPDERLVGAGQAERLPAEEGLAPLDRDADDAGLGRGADQADREGEERQEATAHRLAVSSHAARTRASSPAPAGSGPAAPA